MQKPEQNAEGDVGGAAGGWRMSAPGIPVPMEPAG